MFADHLGETAATAHRLRAARRRLAKSLLALSRDGHSRYAQARGTGLLLEVLCADEDGDGAADNLVDAETLSAALLGALRAFRDPLTGRKSAAFREAAAGAAQALTTDGDGGRQVEGISLLTATCRDFLLRVLRDPGKGELGAETRGALSHLLSAVVPTAAAKDTRHCVALARGLGVNPAFVAAAAAARLKAELAAARRPAQPAKGAAETGAQKEEDGREGEAASTKKATSSRRGPTQDEMAAAQAAAKVAYHAAGVAQYAALEAARAADAALAAAEALREQLRVAKLTFGPANYSHDTGPTGRARWIAQRRRERLAGPLRHRSAFSAAAARSAAAATDGRARAKEEQAWHGQPVRADDAAAVADEWARRARDGGVAAGARADNSAISASALAAAQYEVAAQVGEGVGLQQPQEQQEQQQQQQQKQKHDLHLRAICLALVARVPAGTDAEQARALFGMMRNYDNGYCPPGLPKDLHPKGPGGVEEEGEGGEEGGGEEGGEGAVQSAVAAHGKKGSVRWLKSRASQRARRNAGVHESTRVVRDGYTAGAPAVTRRVVAATGGGGWWGMHGRFRAGSLRMRELGAALRNLMGRSAHGAAADQVLGGRTRRGARRACFVAPEQRCAAPTPALTDEVLVQIARVCGGEPDAGRRTSAGTVLPVEVDIELLADGIVRVARGSSATAAGKAGGGGLSLDSWGGRCGRPGAGAGGAEKQAQHGTPGGNRAVADDENTDPEDGQQQQQQQQQQQWMRRRGARGARGNPARDTRAAARNAARRLLLAGKRGSYGDGCADSCIAGPALAGDAVAGDERRARAQMRAAFAAFDGGRQRACAVAMKVQARRAQERADALATVNPDDRELAQWTEQKAPARTVGDQGRAQRPSTPPPPDNEQRLAMLHAYWAARDAHEAASKDVDGAVAMARVGGREGEGTMVGFGAFFSCLRNVLGANEGNLITETVEHVSYRDAQHATEEMARRIFKSLDCEQRGEITLDEAVNGLARFRLDRSTARHRRSVLHAGSHACRALDRAGGKGHSVFLGAS
jgi:hypothetical protein